MNFRLFFNLGYMQQYLFIGLLLGVLFGVYVFFKTKRIFLFLKKNPKSPLALTIRIIAGLLVIPFCYNIWSPAMVMTFYIMLSSFIGDILVLIINLIVRLATKKDAHLFNCFYIQTSVLVVTFVIFLVSGIYGMNHIVNTKYEVENTKTEGELNICFISDLHFGSIQDSKLLTEKIDEISATNPDIVILGGDITDERTSYEDMELAFSALGKIKSTYGTYFIYGNHDRQPYTTDYVDGVRTYTDEELEATITKNGIIILCDEVTEIGNYVLVGRDDPGWTGERNRKSTEELLSGVDKSKYIIMLDHQPIEQEEGMANGVSLQLSGHTHAGQIFPFNVMTMLTSHYNYGRYDLASMTQIISSGYTGWGWPVRNVAYCEYVTIIIK